MRKYAIVEDALQTDGNPRRQAATEGIPESNDERYTPG
jgi:hypothetical protein